MNGGQTWCLYYKTFYDCNYFRIVLSQCGCHSQSLLPWSNISKQIQQTSILHLDQTPTLDSTHLGSGLAKKYQTRAEVTDYGKPTSLLPCSIINVFRLVGQSLSSWFNICRQSQEPRLSVELNVVSCLVRKHQTRLEVTPMTKPVTYYASALIMDKKFYVAGHRCSMKIKRY